MKEFLFAFLGVFAPLREVVHFFTVSYGWGWLPLALRSCKARAL